MLSLILKNSFILALLVLLQGSLLPYWVGDFILIFIYFWFLRFHFSFKETKIDYRLFWLPVILGFSIFNFKIVSLWMILPYILILLAMRRAVVLRREWILRAKEGYLLLTGFFLLFAGMQFLVREFVLDYGVDFDFWFRFILSYFMGFWVWIYFYIKENSNRIR